MGCGGINSRIHENQYQFNTYPPQVQAQIQSGRIDKGFTEEMVYMARGKPSDKSTVTRGGKDVVLWKYEVPAAVQPPNAAPGSLSTPYGYPTFGPNPAQSTPILYERSYANVEFENGKVVDWDSRLQND